MARSLSKIERSACGFETGLGLGFAKLRKFGGIDAIPSFENLRSDDYLAIISFCSLLY